MISSDEMACNRMQCNETVGVVHPLSHAQDKIVMVVVRRSSVLLMDSSDE